jgi:hypothetical protein
MEVVKTFVNFRCDETLDELREPKSGSIWV